MLKLKRLFVFAVVAMVFSYLPANTAYAQTEIKTPTILEIDQKSAYSAKPLIKGQTPLNTEVLIYVDGSLAGMVTPKIDREANDFSFQLPTALTPGEHYIMLIAKDRTSLVLSAPVTRLINVAAIPAPTIIAPNINTVTGMVKPMVTGLSLDGSIVHIYIDGILDGKTTVLKHESGTANFAYKPFLDLKPGIHRVWARAEDKFGNVSQPSAINEFTVLKPTPAPVLLKTGLAGQGSVAVSGVAKNDSTVKVFIDKKLSGEFKVKNHPSGTASFSYNYGKGLTSGEHYVYTIAYDARGKESIWSNIIYFNAGKAVKPKPEISPVAAEEKAPIAVAPIVLDEPKEDKTVIVTEEKAQSETEDDKSASTEEESKLELNDEGIKTSESGNLAALATGTATGLINESQKPQSKPQLNLIIFILFLVAVILWIFWVNRELIKEKQEAEELEKLQK